jgi:hypothetical protein
MMRQEVTLQGLTGVNAYNGKIGTGRRRQGFRSLGVEGPGGIELGRN